MGYVGHFQSLREDKSEQVCGLYQSLSLFPEYRELGSAGFRIVVS